MGDLDAIQRFTALYDAHHRQVYAYALNRAGRQLADEVVSDTFMVAWRRFDGVPDPPLPWLLGVARNVAREHSRQDARHASITDRWQAWTTTSEFTADDPADAVIERTVVLRALAGMRDEDREVLTLVAWHGLSPQAAAVVLGCSVATFSVRLHRARRRLEQALDDVAPILAVRQLTPAPGKDRLR